MTSIGYGDIVPQPNVPELSVAIISMVVGAILFAHFIGTLIEIVFSFSPEVCLPEAVKAAYVLLSHVRSLSAPSIPPT